MLQKSGIAVRLNANLNLIKKGESLGESTLVCHSNLMKAIQGCLGILKTASIGGGFLFFTRKLLKCLGVGLKEAV